MVHIVYMIVGMLAIATGAFFTGWAHGDEEFSIVREGYAAFGSLMNSVGILCFLAGVLDAMAEEEIRPLRKLLLRKGEDADLS